MAHATSEIVWLHWLLSDMGVSLSDPTPLYCDNQSAVQITHNSVFHERTKHVEIDCHFVRQHLQAGTITLHFSPPISPSSNAPPAAVHLTSGLRNSLAIITITDLMCQRNVVSVTTTEANVLDTTAPSSNALSKNKSPDIDSSNRFGVSVFSYTELEEATHNFDPTEELGDGGFGTVYHGKLQDGWEVAVKRLYEHNCKRVRQFMNEIQILTSLRHPNLVTLYGCTSRLSQELLLVYEYIPNGTVADHLHGDRANVGSLTWPIRMNIAIETASALAYLHASDIIHRDIKTNNILLDNNFCVKVADFGLSRIFPNDVTHVSTAPQGTPGYVDPEYHQCYQLTDKNDVYSFGVVLVELISSMPSIDITRHKQDINLSVLAINRIQNSTLDELVDPTLGFKSDSSIERTITSVAEVAFRCLQLDNVGALTSAQSPSSPKRDDVVLLKKIKSLSSPDFMSNKWVSSSTTSISSG
ncbi:LEAF RUST 10 DISEASE-RESISTANCE LOCUS RECEPTOR-LIKE PROTEIN KINASE-like 1.1 [Camellia sinensis]|uniref:LEAF RUST 10 DISEASE-RESISTANCE LOCUS RECEPTOR-LIKE PROTEIN KINASE-like 1.1 n=1 Tax=Camellia sinensis TaxID=4442 RepID=UPI00103596AD|nr:LEAF RUST 10 DISEASE-RESISTANCE LOCUS RECEPTOR-LIKE PROTEIN KINASE-like 1.1 [Camellia sinensis]